MGLPYCSGTAELGVSETDLPVAIARTGRLLRNPTDTELNQALGP